MWSYINNSGSVSDCGSSSSSSHASCKCSSDMMQGLVVKVFVDLQMSELQLRMPQLLSRVITVITNLSRQINRRSCYINIFQKRTSLLLVRSTN